LGFEPIIIMFCCNWCSYAAADLAGTTHLEYPTNVRIVRVMCSGMVPPQLVLEALQRGADGVLITGCHPGDCHYIEGNLKAERRFKALHMILREMGIEPQRIKLEWISAGEGEKFAQTVKEMVETIRALGPIKKQVGVVARA